MRFSAYGWRYGSASRATGGVGIVRLISCVFPAWNEEENIGPLLDEAVGALPAFADDFEIVVVDDGSTDATANIVRRFAESDPRVRLVAHPTNLGYGHAVRSGLTHTRGDVAAFSDGDRQFRVADLRLLVDRLDDADIVVGHRVKRADPWHRLVIARVYHFVLRTVFGLRLHDVDCGFKLYRREVVETVVPKLESGGAFVSAELLIRAQTAGCRIVEVPVPHHPRIAGRPKGASPRVIARTLAEIRRLRRSLRSPDG
jgi:glycosyltransferase involved in cell wall biosynthesis